MSTTSSSVDTVEITDNNLEILLQEDEGFVEFFNAFLALPCFAERLFYNSELEVFEEFTEKLADDVGKGDAKGASQLRQFAHFKGTIYNVDDNQSRIGYYVTVLEKVQGLEFVKKHRLPLFLRSELYAEYKLTKYLSVVQESFFRDLCSENSDDDEDSGVEEPTDLHPLTRKRSVVSFNLNPSLGDAQSTDGEDDSEKEEHLYLPTHVRSIEETFDAWHESFKRTESRTSMFSSGAGSPYPNTPQIMEEEEVLDTQSSSSVFSAQESDIMVSNHIRPASRMSFVSDNSEKTFSAEVRSRVSSASSVSLALETASQTGSVQEKLNVGDEDEEKAFSADEMTQSLSSVVSFIAEHGQVGQSSSTLENFGDEQVQVDLPTNKDVKDNSYSASKKESAVETEPTARNESKAESISSTGSESVQGVNASDTVVQEDGSVSILEREVIATSTDIAENASTVDIEKELDVSIRITEDHLSPAINDNDDVIAEASDEGKIPNIVETMCTDDEEAQDRQITVPASSFDSNSEANSEVASEELSETTEDLPFLNIDERFSLSDIENSVVDGETERQDEDGEELGKSTRDKEKPSDYGTEADCLHCQSLSNSKRKVAVAIEGVDDSWKGKNLAQSKLLDSSCESSEAFLPDQYIEQKDMEIESMADEKISTELDLNSELEVQENKSAIDENEQETAVKESLCEPQASQNESEPQDTQEGAKDSQDESEDENEDEDDEGGYTTEASATTLQGIHSVLGGRKPARCSTAATSVGFDIDDESAFSEDGFDTEDKPYDLTTKEGLDAFKEFLLDTSGEKMLQFWLEVESGRCFDDDNERSRLVQSVCDRYWKSGAIYEFSAGTKTRLNMVDASKLTYNSLFVIQPDVLEPLLSYWCIRFTMHQQRHSHFCNLDYSRLTNERPKSCVKRESTLSNLPQVPAYTGLAQIYPGRSVTRPQSSTVKPSIQHQTSRPHLRAKSAHPRLLHANKFVHTNASTQQLQYIIGPVRTGYGFEQPPGPSFPVKPEPDYLPLVRLFINPVPSPDSKIQRMVRTLHRTAVFTDGSMPAAVREETGFNPGIMLDSLIQGLIYERQTGNYFHMFLQNSGNKIWMNCLAFWKSLQEYNAYFFADSLNPYLLSRKARTMYANFVVSSSAQDVHVSRDIQIQVHKELEPPYEELFDAVEEHVLHSLLEPWNMLVSQEKDQYKHEVSKEQTLRHIEIQVMARRRQSIIHTNGGLGNSEDEHEKERISVEEANRPPPVPKDGFAFETLIRNRDEVEHFKEFLNKKHSRGIKDLTAWTDMETFRRVPRFMEEKRDKKAREIRESWLGKKYFFGQDSPATREGRNLIMNLNGGQPIKERPQSPVILESQKFVRARIERRWLMLFKQTTEFLERQKPRAVGVPEMVEDIMLKRRLQRSEAAWKILNSRWVSSSRDVVALRQTLLNPSSCSEFTAFVALKGDTLESNVQFWLEVQKFKDLCHAHAQPALIQRKVQTIVDCFLESAIAPELQIDIPIEMAEKLMERLSGRTPSLHPYVFREAQMTVFRVLFNHWKEFVTQRSKIPDGVNPREHFAEQLRRHRTDNRAKKEASERRRQARFSAERKKKEKEEREKKRIEDLASLFSMETASVFYSEEDDLRSWFYSKHLVEQERQEHIKRLREQGIVIPEEQLVEEKEETKSRRSRVSMTKSSTFDNKVHDASSNKKSSEGSSRILQAKILKRNANGQLAPSLGRRSSAFSTVSFTRRNSGVSAVSRKDDKMSAVTEGKEDKNSEKGDEKDLSPKDTKVDKKSERKSSEIQVIPLLSPETLQPAQEGKLLPQRSRSSKRVLSSKQAPKSAGKKRVSLDAISCISDYSVMSNIEFAPRRTSAGKHGRQEGTSLLTSKSLKDFTNSPEGAQLSMPLPLVRITSASHLEKSDTDGSLGEPSPLYYKPRPLTQSLRKTPIRPGTRKGLGLTKDDVQIKPDVIVN